MERTLLQNSFAMLKIIEVIEKYPPSKFQSRVKQIQGKPRDLSLCNFQQVQIGEMIEILIDFHHEVPYSHVRLRRTPKIVQLPSIVCWYVWSRSCSNLNCSIEQCSLSVTKSWGLKNSHFATLKFQIFAYFENVAQLYKASNDAYNHGLQKIVQYLLNESVAEGVSFSPHDFKQERKNLTRSSLFICEICHKRMGFLKMEN